MEIIRASGELKIIQEEIIHPRNFNILKKKNQTFYGNRMKMKMKKIMTIFIIFNANIIASSKNRLTYLKKLEI